ncbi:hypothetical protein [Geminicoccus flavidas]|uniref:hypothetical protein n=1 Tax=Geminicoccus flavidas TaxID=2506407 RepID=UPI00135AC853|nr:hypothetical protein [Geminicoccus flavidas]
MVWDASKPRYRTAYARLVWLQRLRVVLTITGFVVGVVLGILIGATIEDAQLALTKREVIGVIVIVTVCTGLPWLLMRPIIERQRERLG